MHLPMPDPFSSETSVSSSAPGVADAGGPEGLKLRVLVPLVTAVAAVHGVLLWLYYLPVPKRLWGDEYRYLESARKLLGGDPSWRPDPLWPPLYPQFVAGLLAPAHSSLIALQLAQWVLLGLSAVVLHDFVRRLTRSSTAALTAAGLVLLYPPLVGFSHYLWPEVLHLFLLVVVLWILSLKPGSLSWSLVAGVVTGLALLAKSLLGPFIPVLMVAAWARRPATRSVLCAAAFSVAAASTVLPTVVEQHRRTGRWIVADSAAFNLWVGLNDRGRRNFSDDVVTEAYEDYVASSPHFGERDRILKLKIRQLLSDRGVGELVAGQASRQYFRLLDKDSYLTDQLPGGVAVERYEVGYIRAPRAPATATRWSSYLIYALLLATAPLGFLVWENWDRRWLRTLALFLIYNLAVFFWLHVKSRYRIQLLPVLFIGSGAAVAWIGERAFSVDALPRPPKCRLVVGVAIAILLEFLAFGGSLLR
jgi:4-amino-4-deoxy-L-arabinose transferase-like glycosyltransferase